ncbi:MAG: PAS domain S-box protein [Dactylosporangium sp.]|nr:PAS domain S-box protein [Dactylosporangium sp.]NNJ62312.1 PAS domain S-box protein [Dactylosporangium sp.]
MSTLILAGYTLVMAVLGTCVFAVPGWNVAIWGAIGLLSATAMVVGTLRNAPRKRLAWLLLATAMLFTTLGDAAYGLSADHLPGLPLLATVCYFAVLPLTMFSLIALTRASVVLRDRAGLVDLLMFTCAATLVAWVFLVSPSLRAANLDDTERSTIAMCTLGDLLILVVTVRLVLAARRTWSVVLLGLGAAGTLAGDVIYTLLQVHGGWHPGALSEVGYLLCYACWGAAALHPSMVELTMPVASQRGRLARPATVLLRLSLAAPAGTLFVVAAIGQGQDILAIAVAGVIIGELVITRLTDTIERHRRSMARERALREACGALVAGLGDAEVVEAVRVAVDQLMPSGADYETVVSLRERAATTVDTGPPAAAAPGIDAVPAPAGDRRSRMLRPQRLHPELRQGLDRFEMALICPLVPGTCMPGNAGAGVLCVAADERVLDTMRDALEVLAAQATLALERIALSDVINRRDGDQYLRTVVRHTADIVLILDEDGRLRYASPSLTTALGIDPSAAATLLDLVHPCDHGEVERMREQARRLDDPEGVRGAWHLRRADGERILVEVSFRDLRADRMVRGFVITMRDVTERREREQQLIRRALESSSGWQNRQSSLSRFRR